ncbi:solute carrier family 66 member 2-like isoform X1 [Oppia nitens]|uniref:solute carrier family 66 member 2-like isoform X1 n=1 Tax=Oppia nitens TaxID=1686743 RepID=UPI0023DCBAF4|nr:solute carrier family 66 member 2-like isoform X1 [Oppia nitens]
MFTIITFVNNYSIASNFKSLTNKSLAAVVTHMDWVSDEWRELSLPELLSYTASAGIIFGGVLPYVPQYKQIKDNDSCGGFSTYVCLALLLANILRILFWFGRHFETPLLVQSIVMIIAMILLIELCIRTNNKDLLIPNKNRFFIETLKSHPINNHLINDKKCMNDKNSMNYIINPKSGSVYFIDLKSSDGNVCNFQPKKFFDFDVRYFWQWTDFISYIEFLATFTIITGVLIYIMLDVSIFVEAIGFLSVFIEALLGAPQLIKNYQNKSTLGMSKLMVFMWTFGDVFKTSYFIIRQAPVQFWVCGLLQVSIDLFIFGQILYYRKPYKKVSKSYIH